MQTATGDKMDACDYLVIGGGSGGCAVAGRLSEDSATQVAVLEAGGNGNSWIVNTPAAVIGMLPTRINNWAFETVPQAGLNGRRGYQPRGKMLGGSSGLNAMVYIRGHRWDYDHWAALGNEGWSFDEVLPYFIRSENNQRLGDAFHGQSGPLHVSDLVSDNPFQQHFVQAAREAGFPLNDDFNGAEQEGLGVYQVTQYQGQRWTAAHAYLRPHLQQRRNLRVETGCTVTRILFENQRATGVEYLQNGQRKILKARREVILAAGAFQTPQLLQLSGIGDAAQLQAMGIPVQQHLPGVGENLQDHPDFVFQYRSRSLDLLGISASGTVRLGKEALRYQRERRGLLSSNGAESGGFLKTDAALPAPDIQLHFVIAMLDDHARKLHTGHGFSCHMCLLRPKSRGSVRLQSKDPLAAPLIDPAFLAEEEDLEAMVKGFRLTQKLMQAPSLRAWADKDMRTANADSDEAIRALLRAHTDTVYHPVGTCRMGRDAMAVVDPQLRVHGIRGLRIADASVMPTLIGGNTNAPTMMIGEKLADLLKTGH
jgi:choline dehydrogenase-like flavoprotein